MNNHSLKIIVFGAHPDDCDIKAGGIAIKYANLGHEVKFVSVTNGDAGHHEIGGVELARRRRAEAQAAGAVAGIEYHVIDNHDGELEPTLENRKKIIRLIRNYTPDLILTHRPNDYHPDHRYTSILVQDSGIHGHRAQHLHRHPRSIVQPCHRVPERQLPKTATIFSRCHHSHRRCHRKKTRHATLPHIANVRMVAL